jgi:hypothetical protein
VSWLKGLSALLLAAAGTAPAPPVAVAPLDQAAMLRHISYLADDRLEGRKPGTPGADLAVAYIQKEFREMGLAPGAGGNSWLQPVDLVSRRPVSATTRWIGTTSVPFAPTMSVFTGLEARARLRGARVIFAGYGLNLPQQQREDLNGVDVRGAVVLLLSGRPKGVDGVPGLEVRRADIFARGAGAVIALSAETDPWDLIRDRLSQGRITLADDPPGPIEGAMAAVAWRTLLKESGSDPDAEVEAAGAGGFHAHLLALKLDLNAKTEVRPIRSSNVIGKIVGSERPDEAVTYTAHWDHLGICAPPGAPDRICNGAIDNASGVAMMIEIARRLRQGPPPKRSIYFIATTAEESGLLGAKAFVRNPPFRLENIVAEMNLDTVALAPAGSPVAIIGRGQESLDPLIDEAARAFGRQVDDSTAANAFLNRQDGSVFLRAGVPSVMVGGAFSDPVELAKFLTGAYHHPNDDLSHGIELGGAAEDGALHVALGQLFADPQRLRGTVR